MRLGCRLPYAAIYILVVCLWAMPAEAGCGLDPFCAISESIGRGAGRGVADSVRPLVTDIMEREAPALIAQLQTGIDHNILTAEQAGDRLVDYTSAILNKAADDLINHVADQSKSLIDYASGQTLLVEQQIFNDVNKIIDQFHCETLSISALSERQQGILNENVNDWVRKIKFWSRSKTETVEAQCRKSLYINPNESFAEMQLPTTSKLWRCVRLGFLGVGDSAVSIRDGYNDAVANGWQTMCALRTGNATALHEITELWIEDTQSARTWDRAIRGE